jgi:hypothetical protein
MAREPQERFADASKLIQAIEEFQRHRSSHDLTREARLGLAGLQEAVARDEPDEAECYGLFGAARFGFDQALNVWPDNRDAQRGRRETLLAMIRFELDREKLDAAEALANQLDALPEELADAIEQLRREIAARAEELEHLRDVYYDYDANVGIGMKSVLLGIMGMGLLVTGALPFVTALPDDDLYVGTAIGFLPLMATLTAVGWRTFRANRANQVFLIGIWIMYVAACFLRGVAFSTDTPFASAMAFELVIFSVGTTFMAFTLDARMAIPTVFCAAGAIGCVWAPGWAFALYGFATALGCFGYIGAAKAGIGTAIVE